MGLVKHSYTKIPLKVARVIEEAIEIISKTSLKRDVIFKGKVFKFCCRRRMYEIVLPITIGYAADRALLVCGQCGREKDHIHYYDF